VNTYFSAILGSFPFSRALRVIGHENLTSHPLSRPGKRDLHARKKISGATRDAETSARKPITAGDHRFLTAWLAARETQSQTGCPLFITLLREDLILRDPPYNWSSITAKTSSRDNGVHRECDSHLSRQRAARFHQRHPAEDDIEHWMLSTLRFVHTQDVADKANYDPAWVPAYTRDGFERIQKLRLTVAEAQFASQFNGPVPSPRSRAIFGWI